MNIVLIDPRIYYIIKTINSKCYSDEYENLKIVLICLYLQKMRVIS